jgi:hypothetical protein
MPDHQGVRTRFELDDEVDKLRQRVAFLEQVVERIVDTNLSGINKLALIAERIASERND